MGYTRQCSYKDGCAFDDTIVYNKVCVYGDIFVYDNRLIYSRLGGKNLHVYERGKLYCHLNMSGEAYVYTNVVVLGQF